MFPGLARAAAATAPAGATLNDIEHFVFLMQENRSFDEYFGTASGVIGFEDPHAIAGVFQQAGGQDPKGAPNTDGYTLPWHMDTKTTNAQKGGDLDHEWPVMHAMWNRGRMDQFVTGQGEQRITMGYFTRDDIPYHYALADNFTLCDMYFCSLLGPTHPNRTMFMTGMIDPNGQHGGPFIDNTQSSTMSWETFPEVLQAAGIDWYLYQEGGANSDNYGDNPLEQFAAYQDTTTDLFRRGCSAIEIPAGALKGTGIVAKLKDDVVNSRLPQVSWIVGPQETTEHPTSTPGRGAQFIDQVLEALTADPAVWAKTLLIINYDENDGHFDHVAPPIPPIGTADEYVGADPVGLGFRVPCLLISPFTKGPLVCSDVLDHTSTIKLLERRFGVSCTNISAWRRSTVGDFTTAINFAATPDAAMPPMPNGDQQAADAAHQASLPSGAPPSPQVMPKQETTPVRGRPSGPVTIGPELPEVPAPALLPVAAAVVGAGVYALRTRRDRVSGQ
jgi:phospholipase C